MSLEYVLRRMSDLAFLVYYGLRIFVALAVLVSLVGAQWESAFYSFLILLMMLAPAVLKRQYRFYLPFELDLAVVVFVFVNVYLGYVADFYNVIPWWDKFIHFTSGVLSGVVGFLLVFALNEQPSRRVVMTPGFIALFSFSFAMTIGALWEIVEYGIDLIEHAFIMQQGLPDTMHDLIVTAIGACIVAVAGFAWMRAREHIPFTPVFLRRFQYTGKKRSRMDLAKNIQ